MNGRVSMGIQIRKNELQPEMLGDSDKCSIDEDSGKWFKQIWTNLRVLLSGLYADFEEGICQLAKMRRGNIGVIPRR